MPTNGTTYIFIDESGTHKQTDHSVFALVYISTQDIDTIENRVTEIERVLRVPPFHWREHSWHIREQFIEQALSLPFFVKAAVFQNPQNPSDALEWAIKHLFVEKTPGIIIIDGEKPRWIERRLKKTLRDQRITLQTARTARNGSAGGIRLADAFAGLCRAHFDNPTGKSFPLWNKSRNKITALLLGGQVDG